MRLGDEGRLHSREGSGVWPEAGKGTAPTEADMSFACLRNRKVSVAGSVEGRE